MERIYSYNENDVNFDKIDEHANKATSNDAKTFASLVSYLKVVIQDGSNAQLQLARGLLSWIGHAQTMLIRNAPYNTPMNLVLQLVTGRLDHANVYRTFCGHAQIHCIVVTGRSKAIRYRAGDPDSVYIQGHSWNIITADGQKHLVHLKWSINAIIGYAHGGELLMETDGVTKGHMQTGSQGQSQYVFNDFWFCLHPKIFVTRCFPDEPENQLLPPTDKVNSVSEFLALPDLRQAFYTSGLSLITEKACQLKSSKGKCLINLLVDKTKPNSLNFSYELTRISSTNNQLDTAELPLLVLVTRNFDNFEFEIRFPVIGEYRLKLKLHLEDTDRTYACCEFRINCAEIDITCKRPPIDSGIEGFGFGPSADAAGLRNPSGHSGKLYIEPSTSKGNKDAKNTTLKYKVDEDSIGRKEFVSNLYSVDGKGNTIAHPGNSKAVVDPATCDLCVDLSIPNQEEYALVIGVKDKASGETSELPVLKLLVYTDKILIDSQKKTKRKIRQIKLENKINNKGDEKVTLKSQYDQLQTEVDDLELLEVHGRK